MWQCGQAIRKMPGSLRAYKTEFISPRFRTAKKPPNGLRYLRVAQATVQL